MVVDDEEMQVFFAVFLIDGADDHAAAVDAHHFAWWQVGDGDEGLADEFLWFVVFVDAGEDGSVFAGSVVEGELEELFALWHGFAVKDFDGAEVGFREGFEVNAVLEEWLDLYACEINGLGLLGRRCLGFLFLPRACIVQWLHGWEEEHVADRFGIGEEHDHAVDADAEAAGWWQAVFEGVDVVGVHWMGFVVAFALGFDLLFEALALVDWVVELAECVGVLTTDDEEFEAVGEGWVVGFATGERGDFDGIIDDEGWLDEGCFNGFVEEFFENFAARHVLWNFAAVVAGGLAEFVVCHIGKIVDAGGFFDGVGHGDAAPWFFEVDGVFTVLEDGGAEHLARNGAEEVFGEVHHGFVVAVGLIHFEKGEFRVVAGVDAFVAENAADFVHAFHAADDEALEMELKGDAHVEVDIEGVVVGDEWTRVGTAGDGVQHWGFDFEEGVAVEVAADGGDDFGAHDEGVLHVGIHDEVDVALAVAHFGVDETLVLVGQRTDVLRHEAKLMGTDGEFAGLRAEERALDGDDVAEVERLPGGIGFFADVALRDEVLHVAREVADGREARLAHDALEHHAAGAGHFGLELLELFGGGVLVLGADVAEEVRANEVVRIGDAGFAQGGEFGAALGDDVVSSPPTAGRFPGSESVRTFCVPVVRPRRTCRRGLPRSGSCLRRRRRRSSETLR